MFWKTQLVPFDWKVRYNKLYVNSRNENNTFLAEINEWKEYNQALKELQDKFNI